MRIPRQTIPLGLAVALAACADDTSATSSNTGGAGGASTGASMSNGSTGSMVTSSTGTSSGSASTSSASGTGGGPPAGIQTVFLILMENHDWSEIQGSSSAPYINGTLLPMAAHAEAYYTPPDLHPSEPNYIWLEAGDNLGVTDDKPPSDNHQATTNHLTTALEAAGISWKAYAEGISGADCPQDDDGLFAVRHVPQLYFDDVTDGGSATSAHCIAHVRPYTDLAGDLQTNKVARYNFITPNLCDDMHGETFGTTCNTFFADLVKHGDDWLKAEIPKLLASTAYQDGGAIFILWDEGKESLQGASDGPIPLIVLSKNAKPGFGGTVHYNHSSMLRSLQDIFGIQPYIRGAASAVTISDLFTSFP